MTALQGGALGFGLIIGWYVYYVNRYRSGDVQIGDITTLVGAIGGAAVLALFPNSTDLFGYYGIGLAVGFFAYFLLLVILVGTSENFTADWFLDGRRKDVQAGWSIPAGSRQTVAPMAVRPNGGGAGDGGGLHGSNPSQPAQMIYLPVAVGPPPVGVAASAALAQALQGGPSQMPQPQAADQNSSSIIQACKDERPGNADDCNKFVKAVGSHFGIAFTGNADDIVGQIQGPSWTRLGGGRAAASAAQDGKFVVGGLTSQVLGGAHGHVVIVVDGPLEHDLYPRAYWGSLNPAIRPNGGLGKGINWSFGADARDRVIYAARSI